MSTRKLTKDMVVFGFVRGERFFTIKANAPKRGCVTQISGKIGTAGKRFVRGFAVREDMRAFVETRLARKLRDGFLQIA
jgi:hypothetical protein